MKNKSTIVIFIITAVAVGLWVLYAKPSSGSDSITKNQIEDQPAKIRPAKIRSATRGGVRSSSRTPVTLDEEFDRSLYQAVNYTEGKAAGDDGTRVYVRVPSTFSRVALTPNSFGEYPVQPAGLEESVALRLSFPGVKPGTPVSVAILDGGSFPVEKGMSRILNVEKWGGIAFHFTTSENYGHHRLRIQPRGKAIKLVDIYATEKSSNAAF